MNIAELSIQKKVITLTLTVMILGGGIFAYRSLGRLEDPAFTIKNAKVITQYPGASAAEVAEEVTDRIETAIQQMGQLKHVTSLSKPGLSIIDVEIKDNYDKQSLPQVWDELRRKVNDVKGSLPPGAGEPVVNDDFGDVYGIFFAVTGDGYSYADLKQYVDLLRRELLLCQDVAKIEIFAERPEAVYVEISRSRLAQLGIPPEAIYSSLTGQNLAAPAGHVDVGEYYIRIHPTGEFASVEDIGNLLILQKAGGDANVYLKDIATIRRDYVEPPDQLMRFNGRPAIGLAISTVEGGNVVTMGQAVDARLRQLKARTPIGIELGVIAHQADAVTTAVNGFLVSLLEAIAIVVGVLMFAMGLRSGLLIGFILLLTVLATFIVMAFWDITLQRISLGALIIALGMLVDNAIVIVEGILVNTQNGMSRLDAAKAIVKQTTWPLFGATVVAILAFAAIGVSQDTTGEYCRSLFQVILISLLASWVLAITVTPLLGVYFLKPKSSGESSKDPYGGGLFRGYRRLLEMCIRHRWVTVLVLVGMLVAAIVGFGSVRQSFFPESTRPQFMVHCWLPQGIDIRSTEQQMQQVEQYIQSLDGVTDVSSFIGGGAVRFLLTYSPEMPNTAYAMALVSVDDYSRIGPLIDQIEGHLFEQFPDMQAFGRNFVLGPGDMTRIQARFSGEDPAVLRELCRQAETIAWKTPNAADIMNDWRSRVPLIQPDVAEARARNTGITRKNIADALQMTFTGVPIGLYREKNDLLPVIARGPKADRSSAADVGEVQIYSPIAGQSIPMAQVTTAIRSVSEDDILRRRDRQYTITMMCDPAVGEASPVFNALRPKVEAIPLPSGYSLEWGGEYENSGDAQAALFGKLPLVGLAMLLVVVLLFDAIREPLVIFLTVPLAVIGVTVGLLVMDQPFGFMALLGFLSLSGMLIKNSIVLIDEIRSQRAAGADPFDGLVRAGLSRLRPVSMAALTTVLGMIPLLTDAFYVSMAVTIMFGLAFATVLTMVVVPTLYACFYRVPNKPKAPPSSA